MPTWLWLGTVRQWHWISSAVCLLGMLLFAVTGITLNHAGQIEASPSITTIETTLPDTLLLALDSYSLEQVHSDEHPLPVMLRDWLADETGLRAGKRAAEWGRREIYLALPRPGGDAWLSIDLESGELVYESTSRGLISYLNDLHKGRNTGSAWSWFLDAFSAACIIFCITGLLLLQRHSKSRPSTWPLVGLGFVAPMLLILLFIH